MSFADWAPRDAYERRWVRELVTAYWRQERLRGLELAALAAAEAEAPPSEVSLRRLLIFARYGARIDGDIGRALRALLAKGKPKKLALVAVMRKLLVTLNAIAKTNTPWRDQPVAAAA